jgi:CheY-like chemotaxis protein
MIKNKIEIFLSYAKEDVESARKIYNVLQRENFNVWFDEATLLPGQNWQIEALNAIKNSHFFIALFSNRSVKKTGFVQKELKEAIDFCQKMPESEIFIIPVRIDNCCAPYNMDKLHRLDLFPSFETSINKLIKVLKLHAQKKLKSKEKSIHEKDLFFKNDCILIVDDIEEDLNKVEKHISTLSIRILRANNYKDALEILKEEPVIMLVTDIIFPMYKLSKEEYTKWREWTVNSHYYLRTGSLVEPIKKTRIIEEETNNFSEFAGFKLLDDARKINPDLPVIIISRYADLEMARQAIGKNVNDILSKEKHLDDKDLIYNSIRSNLKPVTIIN